MGQQQLLLITLSMIIVGVAVVVGMNMFNDQASSYNMDALVVDLVNLASRAQVHYRKPLEIGGGGGSFALLTANSTGLAYLTNKPKNENGTFSICVAGTANSVTLQGVGTFDGNEDGTMCTARIEVFPDSVALNIINR